MERYVSSQPSQSVSKEIGQTRLPWSDGGGCSIVWETLVGGTVTDTGRIENYDNGSYYGWSDALGFDQFRIASFDTLTGGFGNPQGVALDNVRASFGAVVAPVPLPGAFWLLGGALLAAGAVRRRTNMTV